MLQFFKTINSKITEINDIEDGCWIKATNPNEAEISKIQNLINVERDFIRSALDEEETSRIEVEDDQTLIVVDYPVVETNKEEKHNIPYYTMPMAIILAPKNVVTVCLEENEVLNEIATGVVKGIDTHLKTRFLLKILLRIATRYLQYLKQIDKISDLIEKRLHKSTKNKELIQLLGLEKSLVYFSTSLKSNESVLEKILRGRVIKLFDEDQDLLEDVLIEIKQAIEMATIHTNILSGTMDAFASIISNNLNLIMWRFTIITLVLSIPEIIFSFYGMNVANLPFANVGFIIGLAGFFSAIIGFILYKLKG